MDLAEISTISKTEPTYPNDASSPAEAGSSSLRLQSSSAVMVLGRRLLLAARDGDTAALLELMAKGAPFTADWLGTSPLHLAAAGNHEDTCAVLIRAGVSRDCRTKVARTPLHMAATAGHVQTVQLLLRHGADVSCRDMLGMTPLHWAAQRGHLQAASALLAAGADPRVRCKFRRTPADVARAAGAGPLYMLLREHAEKTPPPKQAEPQPEQELAQIQKIKTPKAKLRTQDKIDVSSLKVASSLKNWNNINIELSGTPQSSGQAKPEATGANNEGAGVAGDVSGVTDGDVSGVTDGDVSGVADVASGVPDDAAELLLGHGITMLAPDTGGTVLSALQHGRTVDLTDAGKLLLKESPLPASVPRRAAPPRAPAPPRPAAPPRAPAPPRPAARVVLRATPVRAPPRGVRVFTLNNANKDNIRYVLPSDVKVLSPTKVPMKAKYRVASGKPPLKIIMNKSNFNKLMATGKTTIVDDAEVESEQVSDTVEDESASETARLRAQLATAHAAIQALTKQLVQYKIRLAQYETV